MAELDRLNESLKKLGESLSGVSPKTGTNYLENELKDKTRLIEEMQQHIDCLKEDLAEAQDNKFELPAEPIKVAEMLIDADYSYKNIFTGMQHRGNLYSKSELRQIAEHILVYCNNSEDE